MQTADLRSRFASRAVARLATVRPDGAPHVVPVVFALVGGTVYSAVDAKPNRTRRLQRLANVRADPRCSLLVDHYEDDWSRLWWVRAQLLVQPQAGPAVVAGLSERLAGAYAQYRDQPFESVMVLRVVAVTGWSAAP